MYLKSFLKVRDIHYTIYLFTMQYIHSYGIHNKKCMYHPSASIWKCSMFTVFSDVVHWDDMFLRCTLDEEKFGGVQAVRLPPVGVISDGVKALPTGARKANKCLGFT